MSDIVDSIIMLTGAEYRKMMAEIAASNHFAVKYLAHIDEQNVEVARLTAEVERLRSVTVVQETLIRKAETENEKLRVALDLYRDAAVIDVTMEGPRFIGSNASALKRAWDADRAALEGK